jgi:hypothetical protein
VSKNWSGVAIEQVVVTSGGSALQVPACQPESTEGWVTSLGAMMSPVSAAAVDPIAQKIRSKQIESAAAYLPTKVKVLLPKAPRKRSRRKDYPKLMT